MKYGLRIVDPEKYRNGKDHLKMIDIFMEKDSDAIDIHAVTNDGDDPWVIASLYFSKEDGKLVLYTPGGIDDPAIRTDSRGIIAVLNEESPA